MNLFNVRKVEGLPERAQYFCRLYGVIRNFCFNILQSKEKNSNFCLSLMFEICQKEIVRFFALKFILSVKRNMLPTA